MYNKQNNKKIDNKRVPEEELQSINGGVDQDDYITVPRPTFIDRDE